jgi:hypothetical protein
VWSVYRRFETPLSHPGFTLLAVITLTDCYPTRTFQNLRYRLLAFFLSYWDSWPVKMRPTRCPETSVNNYNTTPRNIPEERRSHQHRGWSLKSRLFGVLFPICRGALQSGAQFQPKCWNPVLRDLVWTAVSPGFWDFAILLYICTVSGWFGIKPCRIRYIEANSTVLQVLLGEDMLDAVI